MTDIFTGQNSDFHGDESPPTTATGPILITLSGELGSNREQPVLSLYSRSDSAEFVLTHQMVGFGRDEVVLAPADEYYFNVTGVEVDASIDLSTGLLDSGGGGGGGADNVARAAAIAAQTDADAAQVAADAAQVAADAAQVAADAAMAALPTLQTLTDSGRFINIPEPHIVQMGSAAVFDGGSFTIPTNRLQEVANHKFEHNNSTGGGTGIVLDQLVIDLLIAMGRTPTNSQGRYGTEFFVAERQFVASPFAGSSAVHNGVTYYLGSSATHLVGPDNFATMAMWVWAEADNELLAVIRPSGQLWIDEVEYSADTLLTAGWHHVCVTDSSSLGYASAMCRVNGIPNARICHALPVVSRNNRQILKHSAPLIFN